MKVLTIPTCFLYVFICSTVLFSQQSREADALKLLDKVKSIYGNPCEIGAYSDLIDDLYVYNDVYAVKDYLNQYVKLLATIEGLQNGFKRLPKEKKHGINNDQYKLSMETYFYGRERNIVNAFACYYGDLNRAIVDRALNVNGARSWINTITKFYQDSFLMYDIDRDLMRDLRRVPGEWYESEKLWGLK